MKWYKDELIEQESTEVFQVGDTVKIVGGDCFNKARTGIVVMVLEKEYHDEKYIVVYVVVGNRWLSYGPHQLQLELRPSYIPEECLKVLEKMKEEYREIYQTIL